MEMVEPISGKRVRLTLSVDGAPLMDMDLTTAWFAARLNGNELVPLYLDINPGPGDEDEHADDFVRYPPVRASLRLVPLH
jgi:hypothetical protein